MVNKTIKVIVNEEIFKNKILMQKKFHILKSPKQILFPFFACVVRCWKFEHWDCMNWNPIFSEAGVLLVFSFQNFLHFIDEFGYVEWLMKKINSRVQNKIVMQRFCRISADKEKFYRRIDSVNIVV